MLKYLHPKMLFIAFIVCFTLFFSGCAYLKNTDYSKTSSNITKNTVHPIEEEHIVIDKDTGYGYVDNIIIVILKKASYEKDVLQLLQNEDAKIVGRFPKINQLQIRIKPHKKSELENMATQLMKNSNILYAHIDMANSTVYQSKVSSKDEQDLSEAKQDMENPSKNKKPSNEWWYDAIKLNDAKKYIPTKDLVKIGVVDDGFDINHKDLNLKFLDEEQENINSIESHGTHVAGIIQQILPYAQINVIDSNIKPQQSPTSHIATQTQFLKYMLDMVESDVKVINYSMGADNEYDAKMPWTIDYSSINSIYIWLLKQAGYDFIVVQSAGNVGIDAYRNGVFSTLDKNNCLGSKKVRESLGVLNDIDKAQKSVFDSIIIVGASNKKTPSGIYPLLKYTNYGDVISLVAPGSKINSTVPNGYLQVGGTSQASPMVAGAAATLWSLDKTLTSGQIKSLLINSSTELVYDKNQIEYTYPRKTYPLLNIDNAIKQLKSNTK